MSLFYLSFLSNNSEDKIKKRVHIPKDKLKIINPLLKNLKTAISNGNAEKATLISKEITNTLGLFAGVPSDSPTYFSPIERYPPSSKSVLKLWLDLEKKLKNEYLWNSTPRGNPANMRTGLRGTGRPIIAYAILYRINGNRRYYEHVKKGANYLLKLQNKNGLFPFPDLRNKHKLFGTMIKKLLKQKPEALKNGWIVDDVNGDMQYDNGICGVAMIEAYNVTKDNVYLKSAGKASEWALKRPISLNWNYNAFSVWLLAKYAKASGENKYLISAIKKLKLGILPGQMKNGRWFDPHNAKLVYHGIIVRAMLEVYKNIENDNIFKKELRHSISIAIDNASNEIKNNGASSISTSTEMLSEALYYLGENENWEEALNININASLHIRNNNKAPNVGLYLANYIKYLKQ